MSNYADLQLDKLLRKRCDYDAKGRIPPPQLHLHAIAFRFGLTTQEVIERIEAMRKPKDQPA